MNLAVYITGHGFGHATRTLEVLSAIRRRAPQTRFHLRSVAPSDFIAATFSPPYTLESTRIDTGCVELDGLSTDPAETMARAMALYADADSIIERELAFIRAEAVDAVVFDVPPLAAEIAAQAGLPSVAIANFTWDRIYTQYPGSADLVRKFENWYGRTTLALEVPLGHELDIFPNKKRIPIIARKSTGEKGSLREEFGLQNDCAAILVALRDDSIPDATISESDERLQFLTFGNISGPRVRKLPPEWQPRFPDVLAACDAVLSKPGYGIVAECIANRTPLLHLPRLGFAETKYLLAEMDPLMGHRAMTMEELCHGGIGTAVLDLFRQSIEWPGIRTDGAEVAANEILTCIGSPD